ncbi:MAG: PEP-CTERM sorting domain-containing protein [Verrucomicrobia bacterium]|nr:PEP-CTERM sorting domain-containing protein [Verrucomicrobiota bacterium]
MTGAAYLAQAYVGADVNSLAPVGTALPFRTGTAAGYITSTAITTGIAAGTSVTVVMRAWEAAKGATYEAAVAGGGIYGSSNPVTLTLSSPPAAPTDMVGLQSFNLIPEPSTMALGVLGVAALLLRRRQ